MKKGLYLLAKGEVGCAGCWDIQPLIISNDRALLRDANTLLQMSVHRELARQAARMAAKPAAKQGIRTFHRL